MADFVMPALGADMEEGTLTEWLVAPGDEVHRGQLVAVIDTDKADIEVEVFESGRVAELLVEPGTTVAVGDPLARIVSTGEQPGASAPPAARPRSAAPGPAAPAPAPVEQPGHTTSPLVRHLAEQAHLDLADVPGSGPGGSITRTDVERAIAAAGSDGGRVHASPYARRLAAEQGIDLRGREGRGPHGALLGADVGGPGAPAGNTESRETAGDRQQAMRRAIAGVLSRSKREIPHYYLATTIDLHAAMIWLEERNAGRPPSDRLLPAALILKATALAARKVPVLNGFWEDDRLRAAPEVNLGVAVSLRGGGLLAPAIHNADTLSLEALMDALGDVVGRARRGTLRRTELTEGTITVTNLGDRGADSVFGIIQPPQVALVGFGGIAERPWAVDGMLAVRPVVVASLAADHRASDGHAGGQLLDAIGHLLQHPDQL
jgi:pyruvate dehydrogenase E2 component (dihydrolipoamide acetyltransferase)